MSNFSGTIFIAIITSGSALLGVYLTNRENEKRLEQQSNRDEIKEFKKTRLAKAEEVYSLLHRYQMEVFKIHLTWVQLAKGEIKSSELSKKISEGDSIDLSMLYAMLGIYFPNIKTMLEDSRKLLEPASDCYFSMVSAKEISEEKKRSFVRIILDAGSKFDKSINLLLDKLSSEVNLKL